MASKRDLSDAFDLPPPKPRTEVPEERALRFVETPKRKPSASKLRREGPGERVNAYLPPELVEALRTAAFRERRSVSDVLTEAVAQWAKRKSARAQE